MTALRDPQAIMITSVLLVLNAVFTLLYSPVVPLFPGIVNRPEPLGAVVIAAVALVAAFGIWRRQAWGRMLAIGITALLLLRDLLFVGSGRSIELVSVLLDLLLLYVLFRGRWGWPDAMQRR